MEDYVTSKEYSEKLQEAGFEIDTVFWWCIETTPEKLLIDLQKKHHNDNFKRYKPQVVTKKGATKLGVSGMEFKYIPAYTFQQLFQVVANISGTYIQLSSVFNAGLELVFEGKEEDTFIQDVTFLPDDIARVLLACIKEGYIKL